MRPSGRNLSGRVLGAETISRSPPRLLLRMAQDGASAMPPEREGRPIFSVVVPTSDRRGYLEGCLSALVGLEYPRDRFKVVVVDDGDGRAAELLGGAMEPGIRVEFAGSWDRGPAAARNAGAARARGRFVAFTDDDCEPAPDWLTALESALQDAQGTAAGGRTLNGAAGNPCSTV